VHPTPEGEGWPYATPPKLVIRISILNAIQIALLNGLLESFLVKWYIPIEF
jgi:hypothetical protein